MTGLLIVPGGAKVKLKFSGASCPKVCIVIGWAEVGGLRGLFAGALITYPH
jgi:hypothetical protein